MCCLRALPLTLSPGSKRGPHRELPQAKVIVGGAVLTPEYAESIKADKYCKDAMEAVAYAEEFYREERS